MFQKTEKKKGNTDEIVVQKRYNERKRRITKKAEL